LVWVWGGRVPSDDTNTESYYDNFGNISFTTGLLLGLVSPGRGEGRYPFLFCYHLFFHRKEKESLSEIRGECTKKKRLSDIGKVHKDEKYGLPILLQKNMWTDPGNVQIAHRHMGKWGLRPRNSQKRNT
jgi:hypothetical protein